MKKLRIILSFDHELPLGGGASYAKTLFNPTQEVLQLARELDIPIAFFTDILCAKRFKVWDEKGFFQPYREQICAILDQRHDVQLHLHPHWMDSRFKDGRYFPKPSFSFQSFQNRKSPYSINDIVHAGAEFLTKLCTEFKSDYKCIAYRAGGYNLSPEHVVLRALYENGIRIDSSIGKGYTYRSPLSRINYRNMPTQANWFFPVTGPVNQVSSHGLYEIPIASRPRSPFNSLPFAMNLYLLRHRNSKTGSIGIHEGYFSFIDKIKIGFPFSAWLLKLDRYTDSPSTLMKILKYHIATHPNDETISCAAIGHPNVMGIYHWSMLRQFVDLIRQQFKKQVEFCTYRQVYDEMQMDSQWEAPGMVS